MPVLTPDERGAFDFADAAHKGQLRKGGDPYIVHPRRVGLSIKRLGYQPQMVAAGFLHDTLEDTDTTYADLVNEFGSGVADLVVELTTPERPGRRSKAFALVLEGLRLRAISDAAKIVKAMDIYDNLSSIDECPREFIERYAREKYRFVECIRVPSDDYPYRIAKAKLDEVYERHSLYA